MAATALLKFTQGVTVGANGQALKGSIGTSVTVANSDNTNVLSWEIDLVYVDPASAIATATPYAFNNNSTPSATFTPDVRGSYRFVLKVWNAINRVGPPTDVDIRVFAVPELNGLVVPPSQRWPRPLPTPESGEPGAKPSELNFSGQIYGWAGDGATDGLLNELIRRVDSFVAATAVQETITVGSNGQTSFTLSQASISNTTVEMFVNGLKQDYGTDYTVSGATVTYAGAVTLLTSFKVEFWYLAGSISSSSGPSTFQETLVVTDGQTSITLSKTPTEPGSTEMFVNGVKQDYGTDYTVFGKIVTYVPTDLVSSDKVEFWYVIGPLNGTPLQGILLAGSAVVTDPIFPGAVPSDFLTFGSLTVDVGPSVSGDRWICRLSMDCLATGAPQDIAFRIGYSIDGGSDAVTPGATSGFRAIPAGDTTGVELSTIVTGLTAATDLVFKAQLMGGWTDGAPFEVDRALLTIEKA